MIRAPASHSSQRLPRTGRFNRVFTRVVNHCVIVLGRGDGRPTKRRGESAESVRPDS
jgi:hypothetical protein